MYLIILQGGKLGCSKTPVDTYLKDASQYKVNATFTSMSTGGFKQPDVSTCTFVGMTNEIIKSQVKWSGILSDIVAIVNLAILQQCHNN